MLATFYQSRFSPRSLFSAGEQGGWYDPSDFSSMFQDSAGTTPVTAVGQPVGKILDKSGRGNHLIQATAASRPTLKALYNQLTKTEQLTNATWVTQGTATKPSNTTLSFPASGDYVFQSTATAFAGKASKWYGVLSGSGTVSIGFYDNVSGFQTTAITLTATPTAYTFSGTYGAGATDLRFIVGRVIAGTATSVTCGGFDLRTSADASLSIPAYQRVDTAASYDTAGFPAYLEFDGVDDGLASAATVNFTASQQLTFFAGITKTAASGLGALCELSALPTAAGSFSIQAPASFEDLGFYAVGSTTSVNRIATPFAAPSSKVLSCLFNTAGGAGANVSPRVNAAVPTLSADANLGAAVFQNATVYVGRRGGSTFPFIGRLYQLVIRGATSDATAITNTERFVGSKMGIAL